MANFGFFRTAVSKRASQRPLTLLLRAHFQPGQSFLSPPTKIPCRALLCGRIESLLTRPRSECPHLSPLGIYRLRFCLYIVLRVCEGLPFVLHLICRHDMIDAGQSTVFRERKSHFFPFSPREISFLISHFAQTPPFASIQSTINIILWRN